MALSDLQTAVSQNTDLTNQVVALVSQLVAGSVPPATIDALTASVSSNNSQLQAAIASAAPPPTP